MNFSAGNCLDREQSRLSLSFRVIKLKGITVLETRRRRNLELADPHWLVERPGEPQFRLTISS